MLDEITGPEEADGEQAGGRDLDPRPVVADAGYGDCTEFRLALERRGMPYVLAVKATTSAYGADVEAVTPPYSGRGRLRCRATPTRPPPSPRSR